MAVFSLRDSLRLLAIGKPLKVLGQGGEFHNRKLTDEEVLLQLTEVKPVSGNTWDRELFYLPDVIEQVTEFSGDIQTGYIIVWPLSHVRLWNNKAHHVSVRT
jgi:hypothetical protein